MKLSTLQLTKRAFWQCFFACALMLLMVTKVHSHASDAAICSSTSGTEVHHEESNAAALRLPADTLSHLEVKSAGHELKCADRLLCAEDRSAALVRRDGEGLTEAVKGNTRVFISLLAIWNILESLSSVRQNLAPPASWVERILRSQSSMVTVYLPTVILTI